MAKARFEVSYLVHILMFMTFNFSLLPFFQENANLIALGTKDIERLVAPLVITFLVVSILENNSDTLFL